MTILDSKLKCFFKTGCGVAIQNFIDENRFKIISSNSDDRMEQ
jgi:hypothetical protein